MTLPAGVRITKVTSESESESSAAVGPAVGPRPSLVNIRFSDYLIDFRDFEFVSTIGCGSFGIVDRYRDRRRGQDIAVKSFLSPSVAHNKLRSSFLDEIESLMKLRHPCIVSLIGYALPDGLHPARLVMDFVNGNSLSHVFHTNPGWFTPTIKSQTIVGIVVGMNYVHSRGIIHRDLKPSNILFDQKHRIRICDFGSSRVCSTLSTLTQQIGTYHYMAPEMYEGVQYDFKIDVFSFGLILYEMILCEPVFSPDLLPYQVMWKVLAPWRPEFPDWVDPFIRDLITSCWSLDPSARPSFEDILNTLESHDFVIVDGVDPSSVRSFISRVEGTASETDVKAKTKMKGRH
jgi:serine/threonine protein kinase